MKEKIRKNKREERRETKERRTIGRRGRYRKLKISCKRVAKIQNTKRVNIVFKTNRTQKNY